MKKLKTTWNIWQWFHRGCQFFLPMTIKLTQIRSKAQPLQLIHWQLMSSKKFNEKTTTLKVWRALINSLPRNNIWSSFPLGNPLCAKYTHFKSLKGTSKIFCPYLLPWFVLENTQKIVFQTSNLPLTFQNIWNFFFFMGISSLSLVFKSNLCHIIWTWKNTPKISPFFRGWGWF